MMADWWVPNVPPDHSHLLGTWYPIFMEELCLASMRYESAGDERISIEEYEAGWSKIRDLYDALDQEDLVDIHSRVVIDDLGFDSDLATQIARVRYYHFEFLESDDLDDIKGPWPTDPVEQVKLFSSRYERLVFDYIANRIRCEQEPQHRSGSHSVPPPASALDPHLSLFGLAADYTVSDLKGSYRRLAAQYHHDKVNHLGTELIHFANKKFKMINDSYNALLSAAR